MFKLLFLGLALILAGCYQAHSDDDLRTVPTTNNHRYIQDSNRNTGLPGVGY
jgi:hypothetical protein